jgi:hypothetical protein
MIEGSLGGFACGGFRQPWELRTASQLEPLDNEISIALFTSDAAVEIGRLEYGQYVIG